MINMRCLFAFVLLVLCLRSVKSNIDQTAAISSGSYVSTGNASLSSTFIQVTDSLADQAGIVLYSQIQTINNGFIATFTYSSSGCSSTPGDGFTFLISPSMTLSNSLGVGDSLAVVGVTNIALVAFDIYNSEIRVCSTNTPLSWSSNCVQTALNDNFKCAGARTVTILFTPPDNWQLLINGTSKANFTRNLINVVPMIDDQAYVGFSGSTGASYLNQRITSWSFTEGVTCSINNGGCSPNATCSFDANTIQCQCVAGYTGDGYNCTQVSTPVDVPVYIEPVAAPTVEPIAGPTVEPIAVPVDQPIGTPVDTPLAAPASTPDTTPVSAPTMTPVNTPVADTPMNVPVIIPILECFEDLRNGSFLAYFGYNNTMNDPVEVPLGSMNTFGDPSYIGQPTRFIAGRSDYYPRAAFAYLWNGNSLIWRLTLFRLTLDTSDGSRKCPSFARFALTFYTDRELNNQEIDTIKTGLATAIQISPERVHVLSIRYTPVVKRKRGLSVAELELEISAANSTQQHEPSSAEVVQSLIETANNSTVMNQVLDPTGTNNFQFLGIKSAPTGVEQSGTKAPLNNEPTSRSPRGLLVASAAKFGWCINYLLPVFGIIMALS